MKKYRNLLIAFLWGAALPVAAQRPVELQGTVTDAITRRPIAGVTVYSEESPSHGVSTDPQGRFSIALAEGTRTLVFSFLGYETLEVAIDSLPGQDVEISLSEQSHAIEEITVTATSARDRLNSVLIGVERIELAEMAKIPSLLGERDIIRSLQLLPGVKSEGDGSSGFQVRGGTAVQNLIVLDDATIYNAGHLIDIFSTFNDDALTNASLYKGQIPAQFGGAVSSVFDIHTKTGNMQNYSFNGSVGLLSAKVHVEGPLVRETASFFAAARRSYLDIFLKLTEDCKDNTLNFYDLNAKVNYNLSDNDNLFVSFFVGRDNMGLEDLVAMKWGNTASTLRWFHRFNDRLYANTSLIGSSYFSDNSVEILDISNSLDTHIRKYGIREDMTWSAPDGHTLKFGFESVYIDLKSAEWDMSNYREKERRYAWENSAWINQDWKMSKLTVSAGLRLNAFSALGGSPYYRLDENGDILETLRYKREEMVKTYLVLEPRASLNFSIDSHQSLKAGYSRTSQNIHALRVQSMSLPMDRYTLSNNNVKPQTADQFSLGYVGLTAFQTYELSVEGYYKSIRHVLDYKDGKSFNSEIEIERIILAGKGRVYGMEAYIRKNTGRLTGWISYTLSWSDNKIPGIDNDRWYTAGNDRRHDLSVVGMYELPRGWQIAGTWVYNTCQALTAPSAKYTVNGETVYYYAERNGYRAPDYHRLDLSATHTKISKRFTREWSFGLYNAYCRYNPFIISFEDDSSKPWESKAVQTSLFGIIPSVSYSIKF
ncbi:MAG: TonB-dependent receptor [Rikenellaceae bacterium]|nr:TonB-dependent receptor [Rikenellaceae bacterium]